MEVIVAFTTQLKAALGISESSVTLEDGATVQNAIDSLALQYSSEFAPFLLSNGQLMPSVLLSVNDQQVDATAPLSDGDRLTLLSAISGG